MNNPNKRRNYPFKRNFKRKLRRIIFMLTAAAIASGINYYNNHKQSSNDNRSSVAVDKHSNSNFSENQNRGTFSATEQQRAIEKIRAAKEQTNSQFWVGVNAKVSKLLKDDLKGSRHQKFLINITPDISLLVAHNIDLASRVPVNIGDSISLQGRYEWNHRGGVLHWTHRDPKGKKQGGWIRVNGVVYR